MNSPSRSRLWATVLSIVLLIAASAVPILAATHLTHPIDDTYITMVYARSIAQGRGFTFGLNDHPTLGTTTPLNTLLLAALYTIFPQADAAGLAVAVSVICWIATGWLWFVGGGILGLNRLERLLIALLVLIETTIWVAHLGMETWLFVLLLTLCVMTYFAKFRGHLILTGILIGLLFLTRGEGILIAPVIAVHVLSQRRDWLRRGLLIALGAAIILLPWFLYATLSFGSPFPSTLAAKSAQSDLGFTQPFVVYLAYVFVGEWSNLGFVVVTPWLFLFIGGLIYAFRARRKLLIFPAWAILFVIGYGILRIPTYKWYALPVMYIVTVFSACAIAGIAPLVVHLARSLPPIRAQRIGLIAACAAFTLIAAIILPKNIPFAPVGDWRHDVYHNLAQWLDSNTPPDSSVAYVEIGLLGWYGHRRVVDLLGLTNPELIPAVKVGDFQQAIEIAHPDVLICDSRFTFACKHIPNEYAPTTTFTSAQLGGTPDIAADQIVIYTRKTSEKTTQNQAVALCVGAFN